ncbi:MAG: hypothetical protein ABI617_05275 [Sphingomicrobium sp.]
MADLTPGEQRRRWINIGEIIAVAGLTISGLALWNSWGRDDGKPAATIVEQRSAIPLALRGAVDDDGRVLVFTPVEAGHALDSLTLSVPGKTAVAVGSDGRIAASDVEKLLDNTAGKARSGSLSVTIAARYVEAGQDRTGGGRYRLAWRWEKGGLLGGRTLRLTGLNRG